MLTQSNNLSFELTGTIDRIRKFSENEDQYNYAEYIIRYKDENDYNQQLYFKHPRRYANEKQFDKLKDGCLVTISFTIKGYESQMCDKPFMVFKTYRLQIESMHEDHQTHNEMLRNHIASQPNPFVTNIVCCPNCKTSFDGNADYSRVNHQPQQQPTYGINQTNQTNPSVRDNVYVGEQSSYFPHENHSHDVVTSYDDDLPF